MLMPIFSNKILLKIFCSQILLVYILICIAPLIYLKQPILMEGGPWWEHSGVRCDFVVTLSGSQVRWGREGGY